MTTSWFVNHANHVPNPNPNLTLTLTLTLIDVNELVNQWKPSCSVKCEVCHGMLSSDFTESLFKEIGESGDKLATKLSEHIDNGECVSVMVKKVPGSSGIWRNRYGGRVGKS